MQQLHLMCLWLLSKTDRNSFSTNLLAYCRVWDEIFVSLK